LQYNNYFHYRLVLISQRKISNLPLRLRHQTSATKLRYLRSSTFYRAPLEVATELPCMTRFK